MVLVLTVVVLQSISFANYALTTTTTNIIYGSAPYLTFDGGRTRVTNTEALLGISLSDGRTFTPTTNNSSSTNPIELPVAGQSFADIGMLVPTDTNSIELSSLIGTPYNYWGDDDGDGQGVNGITATGSLKLTIVDNDNNPVARNEVLTICTDQAPYRLTLSNTSGRLTTRYGVPNKSYFTSGSVTYYINPKKESSPFICSASPLATGRYRTKGLSAAVWDWRMGYLPQSVTPSSYGLNFPTTGTNKLYFNLRIGGSTQYLSWKPVTHSGITATMTYPYGTSTRVRVTLTGPVATRSQWQSNNSGQIARPSLPQTFELVGRDSSGNAVVKYGFVLKQWFVGGDYGGSHSFVSSKCNSFGYRVPKASDLTNATCRPAWGQSQDVCQGAEGATPSSPDNRALNHIGGGLFTEWGEMSLYHNYDRANQFIENGRYWTSDQTSENNVQGYHKVYCDGGGGFTTDGVGGSAYGICVYP
ncbi:hypothetical protein [Gilliamella apis]|uniref:hypothetical protein n=1 Tax=Gilliamella apis TaxID=1970738 RepID=UPI000D784824|nr:hypothetical protein [Gilliamella apis]PXY93206.1 hypothetical protein DKK77_06835 [Gilliamella apis]WLS97294.1 hypothetical protein RAM03_05335 [Gilliamella apis]